MNSHQSLLGTFINENRVTVGDEVFEKLLSAIHNGELLPGDRLNDSELAVSLGISRTPVREAIQKLKVIGLVESSPNRYTRVAKISPNEVREHLVVWGALMRPLLEEVTSTMPKQAIQLMEKTHKRFVDSAKNRNGRAVAAANFDFFSIPSMYTKNTALKSSIVSEQHAIRLGSVTLPTSVDFDLIIDVQKAMIGAFELRNTREAIRSLERLQSIWIPGAESPLYSNEQ